MKLISRLIPALFFCACFSSDLPASAGDRPVAEILSEIDAIKPQRPDPKIRNDPAAMQEFANQSAQMQARRDDLIWELYRSDPDHERVPKLLSLRWMHRLNDPKWNADEAIVEIDRVLAECKNPRLAVDVAFLRAEAILRKIARRAGDEAADATIAAIDEAIRRAPKDERGAALIQLALEVGRLPGPARERLEARLLGDFPNSTAAASIRKVRRERDLIGKPFVLEFTDAIKGTPVSIKTLKGKVVVIDFWATWCAPCVAAMPRMKELHTKYHSKGVEFIGVNLDQPEEKGGLDRLKEFVAKNDIPWPQYYQGNVGEGSFSDACGVYAIPTVFVVDSHGNLASIDAQDDLDKLIPSLLSTASKGWEK